jgi:3(or 17)beta-hydroxysteroid dehydrogenase
MAGRVAGKVAIVTGGAGGIGGATAKLLSEQGATVVVTDLAPSAADPGDYLQHDVTSEARWTEVIATVEKKHGGLHILVNAAGVEGDMTQGTPDGASLEEWRAVHAINLDGTFLGCKHALPAMRNAGGGSIINISSAVAFIATPFSAPYGSSKAGVRQLTQSVAQAGAIKDPIVRCNSVHPGLIRTRMLDNIHGTRARQRNISFDESRAGSLGRVPMGFLGEPEDVAYMILYLASDEARYVTGSPFQVDGGWSLAGGGR